MEAAMRKTFLPLRCYRQNRERSLFLPAPA
jgi:hypothetical protein